MKNYLAANQTEFSSFPQQKKNNEKLQQISGKSQFLSFLNSWAFGTANCWSFCTVLQFVEIFWAVHQQKLQFIINICANILLIFQDYLIIEWRK